MTISRYQLAQSILGDDFILPGDISLSCTGIKYENGVLVDLGKSVPDERILVKQKRHDLVLVSGPDKEMNLLEIYALFPQLFYGKTGTWYSGSREVFARQDKVGPGWIAFRKQPIRLSLGKKWLDQCTVLPRQEAPANIAQAVWCVAIYEIVRKIKLYQNTWGRTSSILGTCDQSHVAFGREFAHEGLMLDGWNDSIQKENTGIASVYR